MLIVDPRRHPRFAIGESSTPIADFLLAHLADRWGLKELAPLASWGSWKQRYPDIGCGKKRGFSYYRHRLGRSATDPTDPEHSLLVAASSDDTTSDTHWLRSSVDQFLARRAVAAGVTLREETTLDRAVFDPWAQVWTGIGQSAEGRRPLRAKWLIDASGGTGASAAWVGNPIDQRWMRTRTEATFAHFQGVKPFASAVCPRAGFAGDDAAQHHLLNEGWVWMLRMDNDITSVGIVRQLPASRSGWGKTVSSARPAAPLSWDLLESYPRLAELLSSARRISPGEHGHSTSRISRCRARAVGPGWVMLPAAFGIVDPLHSTGIAHSLSGVARVAEALVDGGSDTRSALARYGRELRNEIRWIDTLVSGCYRAQPSFERFVAFSAFYFVATIGFERAMKRDPLAWPRGLLGWADPELVAAAESAWQLAPGHSCSDQEYVAMTRRLISPWNSVGLLDPAQANRLSHTAAPK